MGGGGSSSSSIARFCAEYCLLVASAHKAFSHSTKHASPSVVLICMMHLRCSLSNSSGHMGELHEN